MDIPIEIPVETAKPKRRAVPPRFAAMTKAKETPAPKMEESPKVESKPAGGAERKEAEPRPFRRIRSHPVQDSSNPCSLEEAEGKVRLEGRSFIVVDSMVSRLCKTEGDHRDKPQMAGESAGDEQLFGVSQRTWEGASRDWRAGCSVCEARLEELQSREHERAEVQSGLRPRSTGCLRSGKARLQRRDFVFCSQGWCDAMISHRSTTASLGPTSVTCSC